MTKSTILRALSSLSENSLRDDHNSPSAEITSYGENVNLVESISRGPESDQQNFGCNKTFIGTQPHSYDNTLSSFDSSPAINC